MEFRVAPCQETTVPSPSNHPEALPPIPLISASAENMYLGLRHHPSFAVVTQLMDKVSGCAELPGCVIHEVDGAYANERLHAYSLTQPNFDTRVGGAFLDAARCQNHATHLVTVAMLGLLQRKLLSKLYQLSVFLNNLGYVLRLQLAMKTWLAENLDFRAYSDMNNLQPDPLMAELLDMLVCGRQVEGHGKEEARRQQRFAKKIEAFKDMWNGQASGQPQHFCNCYSGSCDRSPCHCKSRADAVEKMSQAAIDLLLIASPAPPVPNKWTKLWKPVEFVALGLLLNGFLPKIFSLAFKSLKFDAATAESKDADPRMIESLHFHEVQGKRFEGSIAFLHDSDAHFAMRVLFIVAENLQLLTYHWLENLGRAKKGQRLPLHAMFDPRTSTVHAVLQRICHMLLDSEGRGRLRFIWASECKTFCEWCDAYPQRLRELRHVLMSLSALIYKRHVKYWLQFPWPLVVLSDPDAHEDFVAETMKRWDAARLCCVRPGLARELKRMGITSQQLLQDRSLVMIVMCVEAVTD